MISSSTDSSVGTLNTMSVYVSMPTSFPSFITGSLLIFFFAMSLAASSMLAVSFMVVIGLVITCLAVWVSGARLSSMILLRTSRSVMMPTGLSLCMTIMEPMLNLFIVATASFIVVSGRTTLTSLDMTSRTRTTLAIQLHS